MLKVLAHEKMKQYAKNLLDENKSLKLENLEQKERIQKLEEALQNQQIQQNFQP